MIFLYASHTAVCFTGLNLNYISQSYGFNREIRIVKICTGISMYLVLSPTYISMQNVSNALAVSFEFTSSTIACSGSPFSM